MLMVFVFPFKWVSLEFRDGKESYFELFAILYGLNI